MSQSIEIPVWAALILTGLFVLLVCVIIALVITYLNARTGAKTRALRTIAVVYITLPVESLALSLIGVKFQAISIEFAVLAAIVAIVAIIALAWSDRAASKQSAALSFEAMQEIFDDVIEELAQNGGSWRQRKPAIAAHHGVDSAVVSMARLVVTNVQHRLTP